MKCRSTETLDVHLVGSLYPPDDGSVGGNDETQTGREIGLLAERRVSPLADPSVEDAPYRSIGQFVEMDDAPLDRAGDCLGPVFSSSLAQNVIDVERHRTLADVQRCTDRFAAPMRHQAQHVELAIHERWRPDTIHPPGGDLRRNALLATRDGADDLQQIRPWRILEQIALRAGLTCAPPVGSR